MTLFFATLFDYNYLDRGIALLESMKSNIPEFHLFILCLDEKSFLYWQNSLDSSVTPIRLQDLEFGNIELLKAKGNRSKIEYYFTLSPVLPMYILDKFLHVDMITTLDADILFFANPEPIFKNFEEYSILITPHKFSNNLVHLKAHGLFNVSFQSFKRDENATKCLEWWRDKCYDWCHDKVEINRFADQKYLDEFESRFKGVYIMNNIGAGIAPWNINDITFQIRKNQYYINANPLIFYHYHHYRTVSPKTIIHGLKLYKVSEKQRRVLRKTIYKKYYNILNRINKTNLKRESKDNSLRLRSNSFWSELKTKNLFFYFIGFSFEIKLGEQLAKLSNLKSKTRI